MHSKHCSDEVLLAYVDGELSAPEEKEAKAHVQSCWRCRARLTELDNQAQELARLSENQRFPGPARIADARVRFFGSVTAWEQAALRVSPRFGMLFAPRIWSTGARAAVAALCVLGLALWWFGRKPKLMPDDVLAATRQWERGFLQTADLLHQSFRIKIAQSGPQQSTRTSRLEIWSDSAGDRFKSRWVDSGGLLQQACWRPEPGRELVYHPAAHPAVVAREIRSRTVALFAELVDSGLDPKQIETAFIKWLEGRSWNPISLSNDLAVFAGEDGVVVRAEGVHSTRFGSLIRLSAQRAAVGRQVEMVLEVEPGTYRPKLYSIRFFSGERTLEFRMVAERAEVLPLARLEQAVFEPPLALLAKGRRPTARIPAPELMQPKPPATPLLPHPTAAELDSAEIEVRYTLHRARACLGEPVEVLRDSSGIHVRGLAQSAQRKQELLASLTELWTVQFVTVDIQTVDEVVAEQLRGATETSRPAETISSSEPVRYSSSAKLPIQNELERYYRDRGGPDESSGSVQRQITELSNRAVTRSAAALDEAWALRRLAARYPADGTTELHPWSKWLLEMMVRDHLSALRNKVGNLDTLLAPVLSSIQGDHGPLSPGLSKRIEISTSTWNESCFLLFERGKQMQDLVNGLFAGAGLPAEVVAASNESTPLRVRVKRPDEAVSNLLTAFSVLENGIVHLDGRVAEEFQGNPALRALGDRLK